MVTSISDKDHEVEAVYTKVTNPHPVLVVISGPSGVGKDATINRMKQSNHPFYFVVTATTRPKRPS
jgi:guanylate kinase